MLAFFHQDRQWERRVGLDLQLVDVPVHAVRETSDGFQHHLVAAVGRPPQLEIELGPFDVVLVRAEADVATVVEVVAERERPHLVEEPGVLLFGKCHPLGASQFDAARLEVDDGRSARPVDGQRARYRALSVEEQRLVGREPEDGRGGRRDLRQADRPVAPPHHAGCSLASCTVVAAARPAIGAGRGTAQARRHEHERQNPGRHGHTSRLPWC